MGATAPDNFDEFLNRFELNLYFQLTDCEKRGRSKVIILLLLLSLSEEGRGSALHFLVGKIRKRGTKQLNRDVPHITTHVHINRPRMKEGTNDNNKWVNREEGRGEKEMKEEDHVRQGLVCVCVCLPDSRRRPCPTIYTARTLIARSLTRSLLCLFVLGRGRRGKRGRCCSAHHHHHHHSRAIYPHTHGHTDTVTTLAGWWRGLVIRNSYSTHLRKVT